MNSHAGQLYSVLDLSPILEGETAAQSFKHSLNLAQHVEKCITTSRVWPARPPRW
jgi:hypothetical protein